jgi:hypothetical protein
MKLAKITRAVLVCWPALNVRAGERGEVDMQEVSVVATRVVDERARASLIQGSKRDGARAAARESVATATAVRIGTRLRELTRESGAGNDTTAHRATAGVGTAVSAGDARFAGKQAGRGSARRASRSSPLDRKRVAHGVRRGRTGAGAG